MPRLFARVAVSMTAVAALVAFAAPPAAAVFRPGPPPGATARQGSNTEMTMSGTGPGQGVVGFIANAANPFDPVKDGYPPSNPTSGFTAKNEGFAGIIHGTPTGGGATLNLYCIDILTNTYNGIGYELGSWTTSGVPNVGYVARLLNDFYPNTSAPTTLTNNNQKAAAVQAAIWFFSDRYVLNTSDTLRPAVVAIVNATLAAGPLDQPPPPSVTISPSVDSGLAGSVIGPFTVTSTTTGSAIVTATGADMFSDAEASTKITNGSSVNSGQEIWLKSTGPVAAVLQAKATAEVPSGNVYLYDGNTAGVNDAQRLILAQKATLTTTAKALVEFLPTGSLTVKKSIAGPAAGKQGEIEIAVNCAGVDLKTFVIQPGETGTQERTYSDIPAGATCEVTETRDGSSSTVSVTVTGSGQQVTIPSGADATATLTNTYDFVPGSLVINKHIEGEGAGLQGLIRIEAVCDGTVLTPVFEIPSGAPAGTKSQRYDNIPAGTRCTIHERADGANDQVSVVTVVDGPTVTIPAGHIVFTNVTDTYTPKPGSLTVNKTITGDGAGQQGPITITVTCVHEGAETTLDPVINIPAGATSFTPVTYDNIPGGSRCTVTEDPDGHNNTVAVVKRGSGDEITIPPGGHATADLTDTYESGVLVVNKTIFGDAAGHQGDITISTVCNGTPLTPDLMIPANSAAGTYSQRYPNVIAGAVCTVTEEPDGSSTTIAVDKTSNSPVTISANGTATANVTDEYTFVPGSLTVTKTITGSSAGQQGEIRIQVDCGEQVDTPDFVIDAGATGPQSHTYTGIPANTVCAVTETQDGSSSTVAVTVKGSPDRVTVGANETASSNITDTYTAAPGSILVNKTIGGALAGKQGPITITVTCGSTTLPTWTIPAGTGVQTLTHGFDNIPAGSKCTVTETSDGASTTVEATVDGASQTITVPAGTVKAASITDTYSPAPGAVKVVKTIAGTGAGQQGLIGILILCGGPQFASAFIIPAGHAGGPVPRVVNNIPGGASCRVVEAIDGHTSDLAVKAVHASQRVTVPPAGLVSARMTDRFGVEALAVTGPRAPITPLLGIALAAILAGAGAMMLGRRRRS